MFFHASDLKSFQQPNESMIVNFKPEGNDKGFIAKEVLISTKTKPSAIVFDDVRIQLSNIKNYGISTEKRYYRKVYT